MKATLREWTSWYLFTLEKRLVVINEDALDIFPAPEPGQSASNILAVTARNFIIFLIDQLTVYYPTYDLRDGDSDLGNYLNGISDFMQSKDRLKLFYENPADIECIRKELKNFPAPIHDCEPKIRCIHEFIEDIKAISNRNEPELWPEIYRLQYKWSSVQKGIMKAIPGQCVMKLIEGHVGHQHARISMNNLKCLQWGKELDDYYREFLEQGYKPLYATRLARRKFIAAHPLPQSNDDLVERTSFPGLTRPSLQSYQQKYLEHSSKNASSMSAQ